jgi:hypothetical protein
LSLPSNSRCKIHDNEYKEIYGFPERNIWVYYDSDIELTVWSLTFQDFAIFDSYVFFFSLDYAMDKNDYNKTVIAANQKSLERLVFISEEATWYVLLINYHSDSNTANVEYNIIFDYTEPNYELIDSLDFLIFMFSTITISIGIISLGVFVLGLKKAYKEYQLKKKDLKALNLKRIQNYNVKPLNPPRICSYCGSNLPANSPRCPQCRKLVSL